MKLKTILASVSLLALAGAAMADTGKTRAEVEAEVIQARAAGTLDVNDTNYPPSAPATSHLTRAEVQAQVLQARADGTLDQQTDPDYPRLVLAPSKLTRAQVQAELVQARNEGVLDPTEATYPLADDHVTRAEAQHAR